MGSWSAPNDAQGAWGVRRATNGAIQAIWFCGRCSYRTSAVSHYSLSEMGVDIRGVPIVEDYAGLFARCVVRGCERGDVELNHFAPRAIFGADADLWPTGYLCREHHMEWGERVTPHLNRPRRAA